MIGFLILASFKSHAIAVGAGVLVGGALGFLYGGSVEKKAQAALVSAQKGVSGVVSKL